MARMVSGPEPRPGGRFLIRPLVRVPLTPLLTAWTVYAASSVNRAVALREVAMSSLLSMTDDGLTWQLVYTKRHAETWVDANLRKQGFETLMPLTRIRSGLSPL